MEIKQKNLPESVIEMVVEVLGKELDELKPVALKTIQKDLKIKGFRIGKVPLNLVESFAGEGSVQKEILDTAISFFFVKAIQEKDLFTLTRPEVKINKVNFKSPENEVALEIVYNVSIVNFKKLADASKFGKKFEAQKVEEKDIVEFLDSQREKYASYTPKDSEVGPNDRVEIDFEGSVGGIKKEKLQSKHYPVVLGKKFLLDDFEKNLIGMKKSEKKTFKMQFPKDYFEKDFAGETVEFEIFLHDVWDVRLPELDDDFASMASNGRVKNLEKLKSDYTDYLLSDKNKREYEKVIREFQDFLLTNSEIEYPAKYLEARAEEAYHRFEHQFEHMQIKYEDYLEKMKKTEEEMKKSVKNDTDKEMRLGFIFSEIVKNEKLEVDPKEVEMYRKNFERSAKKKPTDGEIERFRSSVMIEMIYEKFLGKL